MTKMTKINASEVYGMVAERLENVYYLYEIKDVIAALSETISDILSEGHAVKVQGIGTFRPKKGTHREFISNLTGEKFSKITKNGVLFKPDVCLSEKLNK